MVERATDTGAHAGLKVASLVAGMVAGSDSIDDMAVLRHGGMRKLFAHLYASSTLGSFLRAFAFGHVRQLDAIAARFLINLAALSPLIVPEPTVTTCSWTWTTPQSRSTGTGNKAPASGTPG